MAGENSGRPSVIANADKPITSLGKRWHASNSQIGKSGIKAGALQPRIFGGIP
jgi:hypothetical protein